MPEYPSSIFKAPEMNGQVVGDVRDFLDKKTAIFHPFRLLRAARSLSRLIHDVVDDPDKRVHSDPSAGTKYIREDLKRLEEIGRSFGRKTE